MLLLYYILKKSGLKPVLLLHSPFLLPSFFRREKVGSKGSLASKRFVFDRLLFSYIKVLDKMFCFTGFFAQKHFEPFKLMHYDRIWQALYNYILYDWRIWQIYQIPFFDMIFFRHYVMYRLLKLCMIWSIQKVMYKR